MRETRDQLLMQEMTRKQFLQYLAGGLVALFGFNNLLSLIMHKNRLRERASASSRHGFGSRKFGA